MKLFRIRWKEAVALLLIGLWWGIPALRIWQADRLVDELCARNGGFNVYEPVLLSADEPDPFSQFEATGEGAAQVTAKYGRVRKTRTLRGKPDPVDGAALVILEDRYQIVRSSDKRLLGEVIAYTRKGGDPVGPWDWPSHSCPKQAEDGLEKRIFRKPRA
ncbi:hypothetical protein [Noviherbaspirillum sp. ST9]|uniref:hypothetical protein n=1 Tax=Noviherbaspirillum sp. ST9 TaxID=3401606 RepID=UPI003B588A28